MKIALFGKQFEEKFLTKFLYILSFLEKKKVDVLIYDKFADYLKQTFSVSLEQRYTFFSSCDRLNNSVAMLLSIGGDGTFLDASMLVKETDIPILGINSGRLGFLSAVGANQIEVFLDDIINGNYTINERAVLRLVSPEDYLQKTPYALNEMGVFKADTTSMVTVKAYVGEELVTTYWADGLLVATPTGSTAYALSAGGPIVHPDCANLLLVPVSPHNLTMRPIVIPDDKDVLLEVTARSSHFLLSLDAKCEKIPSGTQIRIKKADFKIKVVSLKNMNFYKTLRNKLMWGIDKRN